MKFSAFVNKVQDAVRGMTREMTDLSPLERNVVQHNHANSMSVKASARNIVNLRGESAAEQVS
jgi:hypothetical protein